MGGGGVGDGQVVRAVLGGVEELGVVAGLGDSLAHWWGASGSLNDIGRGNACEEGEGEELHLGMREEELCSGLVFGEEGVVTTEWKWKWMPMAKRTCLSSKPLYACETADKACCACCLCLLSLFSVSGRFASEIAANDICPAPSKPVPRIYTWQGWTIDM